MTVAAKVAYFKKSVRYDRMMIRWFLSKHAPRTLERRSELGWYLDALTWHRHLIVQYTAKLAPAYTDLNAWLCIHHYEGAWNSNTGNGYYGGLQMDLGFQSTYGPELLRAKGTADHWTPAEQIGVARRARDSGRGYYPWPNTARYCGLI